LLARQLKVAPSFYSPRLCGKLLDLVGMSECMA
jgi:hypothetical protein